MELTNDQKMVFDQIMRKLGVTNTSSQFSPKFQYTTIGGLAGTGKTFLITALRQEMYNNWKDLRVAFVAFTAKAKSVLNVKLEQNNSIFVNDTCRTIHSLIYEPIWGYDKKEKKPIVIGWKKKDQLDYDLIFVDEASMVNKVLWEDLYEYNVPIIAVGDHGQLPPVGDNYGLMLNPEHVLTEIKRQALDNPIIRVSLEVRQGKPIPYGLYDQDKKTVFKTKYNSVEYKQIWNNIDFSKNDIIFLCAKNSTRVSINQMIRDKLSFGRPEPYPGERVIFLKNNYISKVMNGMLGKVLFLSYESDDVYFMTVLPDDYEEPFAGLVYNGCFGRESYEHAYSDLMKPKYKKVIKKSKYNTIDICDFGYCITTHKSQGSEFKNVVVFEEYTSYMNEEDRRRWMYTACTRAKDKLLIVS